MFSDKSSREVFLTRKTHLIYTVRRIAWFWFRRKAWQAAISFGELHANFDPEIPESPRDGRRRCELKHLSNSRKRKHKVIPLIAESEKGRGQTESALETRLEMW